MKDEEYWASTLVPLEWQQKIAQGTTLIRRPSSPGTEQHKAAGRGPFGKLSQMGLMQMVHVGSQLRDELYSTSDQEEYQLKQQEIVHDDDDDVGDSGGRSTTSSSGSSSNSLQYLYHGRVWSPSRPLHPKYIKVFSTDFERTIQSAQGVLVGLFPDGISSSSTLTTTISGETHDTDGVIAIDCRHTNWMIPDPQPRQSTEQVELENSLAAQAHIVQRDQELYPLALRTTNALRHLLADDAFSMNFGVGEEGGGAAADSTLLKPLPWAQLAEILKCLSVRNKLPPSISHDDTEVIAHHLAWRWLETLRHPRMSYLAMNTFATHLLRAMVHAETEVPALLYSAHDSTLIGLMCVFRLEQPAVWPDYASFLKIELMEILPEESSSSGVTTPRTATTTALVTSSAVQKKKDYVVRFSLNGQVLKSTWRGKAREFIPLHVLAHHIKTEGAVKASP
jgi:hypothetical protein